MFMVYCHVPNLEICLKLGCSLKMIVFAPWKLSYLHPENYRICTLKMIVFSPWKWLYLHPENDCICTLKIIVFAPWKWLYLYPENDRTWQTEWFCLAIILTSAAWILSEILATLSLGSRDFLLTHWPFFRFVIYLYLTRYKALCSRSNYDC